MPTASEAPRRAAAATPLSRIVLALESAGFATQHVERFARAPRNR